MINEFGLEYDLRVEHDRRYLFLRLLERLKHAGVPLDGVGLQAHLDLSKGDLPADVLGCFLKDIADLGLFILISELDVKEYEYGSSPGLNQGLPFEYSFKPKPMYRAIAGAGLRRR